MKTKLLALVIFALSLTSCGVDDFTRKAYLSAKYKLAYAADVGSYSLNIEPAYFFQIPNRTDFIECFNKDESFVSFETKINSNKRPVGTGNFSLKFNDSTISSKNFDFDYFGYYDGVYGGEFNMINNTKPDYIGRGMFRGRYWWVRFEVLIPEICENKLLLEFQFIEQNHEPSEFDHKIW